MNEEHWQCNIMIDTVSNKRRGAAIQEMECELVTAF